VRRLLGDEKRRDPNGAVRAVCDRIAENFLEPLSKRRNFRLCSAGIDTVN